jgi:nitric oxide reductase large subunit
MTQDQTAEQLSPWWKHAIVLIMAFGFTILIWRSVQTYSDAPPIPQRAVTASGETVFTHDDIVGGQRVFLKYGLMDNGTIWGHGAYLGPDLSADYLHMHFIEWLRMPADLVFIGFGVVPLLIAGIRIHKANLDAVRGPASVPVSGIPTAVRTSGD